MSRYEALSEGVEWAQTLLENKDRRRKSWGPEFASVDVDASGALSLEEAMALIKTIMDKHALPTPRPQKIAELLAKCDMNGDGELERQEFPSFFKSVLENVLKKARLELSLLEQTTRADAYPSTQLLGTISGCVVGIIEMAFFLIKQRLSDLIARGGKMMKRA